ncbi:MAG: hypothetical protein LIO79_08130 [Rikenellaceae bacterium]|nr:hypothetical protein [Rikenellaceae bacterium]
MKPLEVSSTEFRSNMKFYMDVAVAGQEVIIQRGNDPALVLTEYPQIKPMKPDADFARGISREEIVKEIHNDIDRHFDAQ